MQDHNLVSFVSSFYTFPPRVSKDFCRIPFNFSFKLMLSVCSLSSPFIDKQAMLHMLSLQLKWILCPQCSLHYPTSSLAPRPDLSYYRIYSPLRSQNVMLDFGFRTTGFDNSITTISGRHSNWLSFSPRCQPD
jgi:hypothetical protein